MTDALARAFGGHPCALTFRWRTSKAELVAPATMRTGHLFHTLRMIWNHVMPTSMQVGYRIRRYTFGPHYTAAYMRSAILEIGRELFRRPDLTQQQRVELTQMADFLFGKQKTLPEPILMLEAS